MIEIIAYEMQYDGGKVKSDLILTPFSDELFEIYIQIYNECFFQMRKALEVEPYNFYSSIEQIADKKNSIYLWIQDKTLIGSVACYGNEIDDLIVNKQYQGKGYGKQLLLWAINHIQNRNELPIQLHVAKWNTNAISLYERCNFTCIKTEKVK